MPENEKKTYRPDLKKAKKTPPLEPFRIRKIGQEAKKAPPPEQRGQILRREPLKEIKKVPPPERRKPKEEKKQ